MGQSLQEAGRYVWRWWGWLGDSPKDKYINKFWLSFSSLCFTWIPRRKWNRIVMCFYLIATIWFVRFFTYKSLSSLLGQNYVKIPKILKRRVYCPIDFVYIQFLVWILEHGRKKGFYSVITADRSFLMQKLLSSFSVAGQKPFKDILIWAYFG